jgi:hypothetical protein
MCLVKSIEFCGKEILTAKKENQIYVGVKSICENIGLDYSAQLQRMKRDEVLNEGMVVITTPSNQGEQDTNFIPLEYLNGFLFGISLNRVANEKTRELLVAYKKECYKVLANHFLGLNTQPQVDKTYAELTEKPSPQDKLETAIKTLFEYTASAIKKVVTSTSPSDEFNLKIARDGLKLLKELNYDFKLPTDKLGFQKVA